MGAALMLASQLLSACTSIPAFLLNGDGTADAPAGPKVAALIANLKCELWDAAQSKNLLPYYTDDPHLQIKNHDPTGDRAFTLNNIFQEIEYVGEATFTLDVTDTGGFNPSAAISEYIHGPKGLFPATGVVLSVGGQLSEAAHRQITLDSSMDFSRLVESVPNPLAKDKHIITPLAKVLPAPGTCDGGSELGGRLGVKEALATGIIATAMNDIAVFPAGGSGSGGSIDIAGVTPAVSVAATYAFGQISAQIDFTIIENINGGPTWTLTHFKGPGGNSSGLLNINRQVKDTLTLTFVPVCIRQKYFTNSTSPPYEYKPEMVDGTPGWANYLPRCTDVKHLQSQVEALTKAKNNNSAILLQNSLAP